MLLIRNPVGNFSGKLNLNPLDYLYSHHFRKGCLEYQPHLDCYKQNSSKPKSLDRITLLANFFATHFYNSRKLRKSGKLKKSNCISKPKHWLRKPNLPELRRKKMQILNDFISRQILNRYASKKLQMSW